VKLRFKKNVNSDKLEQDETTINNLNIFAIQLINLCTRKNFGIVSPQACAVGSDTDVVLFVHDIKHTISPNNHH